METANPYSRGGDGRPPASQDEAASQPSRVDDDDASVARAQAEMSVMAPSGPPTGIGGEAGAAGLGERRRPAGTEAANAAIQGTAGGAGGEAGAFEVVDEGGELVRVRFHEFLQN